MDIAKIEDRIDRVAASATEVNMDLGGIRLADMGQVMELAKLMSIAKEAVPPHCQGEPGVCLAICSRALRWGMDPFAVAEKSYVVDNRGTKRLAYESQLVHAVIEAHAPLQGRLRRRYEGEGPDRVCIVWGTFKGETEPHEHRSPPLKDLHPGYKEGTKFVKGSQLWDDKPDVQLFYDTSRDWARLYCPEVLLGVYARDEFPDADPTPAGKARDVTPKPASVKDRLPGASKKGFDEDRVLNEINDAVEATPGTKPAEEWTLDDLNAARAMMLEAGKCPWCGAGSGQAHTDDCRWLVAVKRLLPASGDDRPKRKRKAEKTVEVTTGEPVLIEPTADNYEAYVREWTGLGDDPDAMALRWDDEDDLRTKLKVPVKTRIAARALVDERVAALREAKRG